MMFNFVCGTYFIMLCSILSFHILGFTIGGLGTAEAVPILFAALLLGVAIGGVMVASAFTTAKQEPM